MPNNISSKMNPLERKAATSLATVMSLRMLGLFMILPVFSLYANGLIGATPFLIGLAMGVYGLTQGIFQIPFGMLSDKVGRRKMITLGLLVFALGSGIAAMSHTITGLLIGRALQGVGAVGSTIMAMIADLTREEQRTKAMAIAGMSIGLSFSLAMMLGPLFYNWLNIFWLAVFFSFLAIFLLFFWVPTPAKSTWHSDAEPELKQFSVLLKEPKLLRLNAGIFLLHALFTASFVVIPISLQNLAGLHGSQQWMLYLPILTIAFLLSIPCIVIAEKKQQVKKFFRGAIFVMGVAELILWIFAHSLLISAISLLLFFTAFSVLEAFLPSLVSKTAPRAQKGTALGIYSCSQFLGIFVGGSLGGWLYGAFGLTDVYLFCVVLTVIWFLIEMK
jgi:predicted MFS family arabinose efflux permease